MTHVFVVIACKHTGLGQITEVRMVFENASDANAFARGYRETAGECMVGVHRIPFHADTLKPSIRP